MSFKSFDDFKEKMVNLIRFITGEGDRRIADYKAACDAKIAELTSKVETISAQATEANNQVIELRTALAASNDQVINAKAAATADLMSNLDALTTELENEFKQPMAVVTNETPVADAAIQAIVAEPAIDTSVVEAMPAVEAVGEPEPTPAPVLEAALTALADSAPTEVVPAE